MEPRVPHLLHDVRHKPTGNKPATYRRLLIKLDLRRRSRRSGDESTHIPCHPIRSRVARMSVARPGFECLHGAALYCCENLSGRLETHAVQIRLQFHDGNRAAVWHGIEAIAAAQHRLISNHRPAASFTTSRTPHLHRKRVLLRCVRLLYEALADSSPNAPTSRVRCGEDNRAAQRALGVQVMDVPRGHFSLAKLTAQPILDRQTEAFRNTSTAKRLATGAGDVPHG